MLEAKHKSSILEHIMALAGKGATEATLDWIPEKRFSDLSQYIRKKFGPSLMGNVTEDTDSYGVFRYTQVYNKRFVTSFIVEHLGDYATRLQVTIKGGTALYNAKYFVRKADKELETVEKPKKTEAPSAPLEKTVDYSSMDMAALIAEMDNAVKSFGKEPSAATFKAIPLIKDAVEAKIDDMPPAKRAAFSKAIADMGMYVQAITSQLAMPMVDIKMFAGTYVSQMKSAVASMAAALE